MLLKGRFNTKKSAPVTHARVILAIAPNHPRNTANAIHAPVIPAVVRLHVPDTQNPVAWDLRSGFTLL